MRRWMFLILLILAVASPLVAQEGYETAWVKSTGDDGGLTWLLPDTSVVFPLYQRNVFKFFFHDTYGVKDDSCLFAAYLYGSSVSNTFDSTFSLIDTLFYAPNELAADGSGSYSAGTTRAKVIINPDERYGVILMTILPVTHPANALSGRVYRNQWTNQRGAKLNQ